MNWSVLVTFACGIGAYLVFLGIFTLIKYLRNKKKVEKEIKDDEKQNQTDANQK